MELPRDWLVTSGRRTSRDPSRAVVSVVRGIRSSAAASDVSRANRAPGYCSTRARTSARTPSSRGAPSAQSSATMLAVVSTTSTMSVSVASVWVEPPGSPGRSSITAQASTITSRRAQRERCPARARRSVTTSPPARGARTSIQTAAAATPAHSSTMSRTGRTGWKITGAPSTRGRRNRARGPRGRRSRGSGCRSRPPGPRHAAQWPPASAPRR
ncbi:Uncharacterised protein [Mycobacterium tuberculosis]|nr:Uncharacterised protein [Mycobacterium tuberculosis]